MKASGGVDPHRLIGRRAQITLRQPLAQITGGNPHDGIVTRIVVRRAAKYLHRDGAFFELGFLAARKSLHRLLPENSGARKSRSTSERIIAC